MSAPSVFLTWTPVRNVDAARAWSPAPSFGSGTPGVSSSPLSTRTWSRNGASGSSTGVHANRAPSAAGVHRSMMIPFGAYTTASRRGAFTVAAAKSGNHAVEQRQGERGAKSAQERATRQAHFRDDHRATATSSVVLRLWLTLLRRWLADCCVR